MADRLDVLRQDALQKRIHGVAGGNHVMWMAKDMARIADHVNSIPEKAFRDAQMAAPKLVDFNLAAVRRKFAEAGVVVKRDTKPGDLNFMFTISAEVVDLSGDVVTADGVDTSGFIRNPTVLNCHDSSALPIAVSTAPQVLGKTVTAIAQFPETGVSDSSDQVVGAIRAGLVRAASIGFIPLKWAFSKDASRPFGVDFFKVKLLEWSIVSQPCCPSALLIGAVSGGKSASRSTRNAPLDGALDEDAREWQCCADSTMPINATDDKYDDAAAKAAVLARCSPGGTILDEAKDYFLAVDISKPFIAKSYMFPFCNVTDAGIVASKVGWREALAALENSTMPGTVVTDAQAVTDLLEARLGDIKTASRRREARALAARARSVCASIGDDPAAMTRAQRLAEAHNFRRATMERAGSE